jgi:hypothetical protein
MHDPEQCLNAASIVYFIDEAFFHERRLFCTCLEEWPYDPFPVFSMNFRLPKNPIAVTMLILIDDLLEAIIENGDYALSGGNVLIMGFFGREN